MRKAPILALASIFVLSLAAVDYADARGGRGGGGGGMRGGGGGGMRCAGRERNSMNEIKIISGAERSGPSNTRGVR